MLLASGLNFGLRRSLPHMLGVSLGSPFAGVIGALMQGGAVVDVEPTRSVASVPARDVLQVRFRQSTAERELRGLLYATGARIVDGPDQLGDYLIEPRGGSLATLQAELERSESVQSVRVLKAWKPEPRQE